MDSYYTIDPIKAYIDDMKQYPMLSHDEESELFAEYIKHPSPDIKTRIITGNLRLVFSIAKRYNNLLKHRMVGIDLMDLIQAGNQGLIEAVDKFDPEKGVKFATYAGWWIRQKITRLISNQSRSLRIPMNRIQLLTQISDFQEEFFKKYEYEATVDDIAEHFEMDVGKITQLLFDADVAELDEPLFTSEGEEFTLGDINEDIEAEKRVRKTAEVNEMNEALEDSLMLILTDDERDIIEKTLGISSDKPDGSIYTLEEVAMLYGKTRQWVHIQRELALYKLRKDRKLIEIYLGLTDQENLDILE